MRQRGSILVGVLWCMVLLSVLVIGVLHTARMVSLVVKNYGDRVQAHYLALAGVERAKALLYQDVVTRQGNGQEPHWNVLQRRQGLSGCAVGPRQISGFRCAPPEEGGGLIYGISDEESRANLNIASPNQLTNLTGMTPDILGAQL